MTEPDPFAIAVLVARAFEALQMEYALVGSGASSFRGEPRSTRDLDFLVRMSPPQVAELARQLGPDFDVDEDALRQSIVEKSSFNIFYLPIFFKIDLFTSTQDEFAKQQLARRTREAIPSGGSLFVATAEDTLLYKLVWFRMGGEVSDQQWRDVLGILRVSAVDREYLKTWAERLGVGDLLTRVLAQA